MHNSKNIKSLLALTIIAILTPFAAGEIIANQVPVADAGLPRYAATDPVVLDGSGSYDPDNSGILKYQWQQVSGPTVTIGNPNAASPTISGFVQTNNIQRCEFELIVNDGDSNSPPDRVEAIIVPSYGNNPLVLESETFDPEKPTVVFFGGGNCTSGGYSSSGFTGGWLQRANFINCTHYEKYSVRPFERYGDMLIVYLSSLAPDYKQAIQIIGQSTGNRPSMAISRYINQTYHDGRYAVNRLTALDAVCTDYQDAVAEVTEFLAHPVDKEQCWVDSYRSEIGWTGHYAPYIPGALNTFFLLPAEHKWAYNQYKVSSDTPYSNNGVVAFGYLSVIGQGKNYQLATDKEKYYFKIGPTVPISHYDETIYPGRMLEPVTLIEPQADAVLEEGVLLTCEESENAVGYQLLVGSDPHRVMDFKIISDTAQPPTNLITQLPEGTWFWTIKARDKWGSTIYADPVHFPWPTKITVPDDTRTIQKAIDRTRNGSEIIVKPGVYREKINFLGKNLIVRSTQPDNPHVVAKTIIDSNGLDSSTVTFAGGEDANCVLNGFTITGGTGTLDTTTLPYNRYGGGIYCNNSSPTIINNVIVKNFCPLLSPDRTRGSGGGIYCNNAGPSLRNNVITNNEADSGGGIYQSSGLIANCTITGNSAYFGGGLFDCSGDIVGCIISDNDAIRNGAAMYGCSSDLNSCTITGNIASASGGGLMQCKGAARNSIFADNSKYAIYDNPIGYVEAVQNCCFYGNPDGDWYSYTAGSVNITGADAINALDDANGVIDCNPCFVDPNNGNFRLMAESGCIDAGKNFAVPAGITTDLDGLPRFIDYLCTLDTGVGSPPIIDIGAHEFLASDIQRDGNVGYGDFNLFADHWRLTGPVPCSSADLDCDGDVDLDDLSLLSDNWLTGI